MGDIKSRERQFYFIGRSFPDLAAGYVRDRTDGQLTRLLHFIDAHLAYDDCRVTMAPSRLVAKTEAGAEITISFESVTPSIHFDIAHTCLEPEHWLYWRTIIEAEVSGWDAPARDWFEASRYGLR
jgi:hypothetical protein